MECGSKERLGHRGGSGTIGVMPIAGRSRTNLGESIQVSRLLFPRNITPGTITRCSDLTGAIALYEL